MNQAKCEDCLKPRSKLFRAYSSCGYHDWVVCLNCLKAGEKEITFTHPGEWYKNKSYTIPLELVIPDFPFTKVIGTYCPYTKETTISNNKT